MYTCMTCELEFDLQDYVLGTDFVCPHCLVVDSEEIDPAQAGLISIVIYIFKLSCGEEKYYETFDHA